MKLDMSKKDKIFLPFHKTSNFNKITKRKILVARFNVFIEVHFLFRSHFLKD